MGAFYGSSPQVISNFVPYLVWVIFMRLFQDLVGLVAVLVMAATVKAQVALEAVDALGADQFGIVCDRATGIVMTGGPALSTLE